MYIRWTEEECEVLRAEYKSEKTIIRQLARKLNRSPQAIHSKAGELGLYPNSGRLKHRNWEPEELAILEKYEGSIPVYR